MNTNSELAAFLELCVMLVADPRTGVLLILLLIAAVIDFRTFRIPNWLTGGGLVFALAYNTLTPPNYNSSWAFAPAGMLVGLALTLPLYAKRIIGAGDVKLMAMVGAFLGVGETVFALLFSFVASGVAALLFAATHGLMRRMLGNVRYIVSGAGQAAAGGLPGTVMHPVGSLAFGISIAVGTAMLVTGRHFNVI